ncbi:MAG: hypothetical protein A3F18_08035 [Legionellales bacterium RIFCSPHIGHO2_12_FULL_37_14]|nr:MAG: hypothetical protein A3F18_08035 [Legionellales bacterium RIFCSPHIGHO2_12_FULL_37_14]
MYKQLTLILWSFFLATFGWAQNIFPHGCEAQDFQFYQGNLVLNKLGEQRLFIIYNHGTEQVEIKRLLTEDEFMAPNFLVYLAGGNWSAFASDLANLQFECHTKVNDFIQKVDCGQFLDVCVYPRAKFALSNMGNYWVSANKQQQDVVNEAAAKGIYLHW